MGKIFSQINKKWIAGILAALGIGGAGYGTANLGAVISSGDYQIVSGVRGYITKTDPTVLPPDILVSGSQNVIINDQERVESRAGYELSGQASTSAQAVEAAPEWLHSEANTTASAEYLLRQVGGILQFSTSTAFLDLFEQGTTTKPIRFTTAWSATELMDVLLFVNASSTLFEWSGGLGSVSATTSNTIVLNEVIGESRFFLGGTRQLRGRNTGVGFTTYTYTGISGSTFTGISPDPSNTFDANAVVVQAIRSNVNTPSPNFVSDTIKTLNNQVWMGSENSRRVYVSKDTSYTDFTFSSPRVPGEGALLTLDDTTIGFESPDDEKMLVFSGKDRIYQVTFEVSPGSAADREVPRVRPLLVSSGQGALSQELIGKIKQAIVWVSNNKELVELGQVENLPSSQAVAISDPIKPDFANAAFTNGEIEFWRNNIFITAADIGETAVGICGFIVWPLPV